MSISEPMTMLTDYVLGAVAFALAARLRTRARGGPYRSQSLWAGGLATSGVAALLGGTYHGFASHIAPGTHDVLWRLTVLCIGLSSLLTLSGTLLATVAGPGRGLLLCLVTAKAVVFVIASSLRDDFVVAVVDYVVAMLAILALEFLVRREHDDGRRWWFLSGLLISFAGAGLQQAGFGFHEHFNHNDLYHVIQTAALFLLYRGALRLRDV